MSAIYRYLRCLLIPLALAAPFALQGDVGIIVYDSKGVDQRRVSTGHIALITTRYCASGTTGLRDCEPDEEPGAVLTRYANVASGYPGSLFVIPLLDHFTAVSDPEATPILSSGRELQLMQQDYWRSHLRPYLPPLTQQQYLAMKKQLEQFDAGRTFRRAITLEYLMKLVSPPKPFYPTEPIAIVDEKTNELIPEGRWRESVGTQHMRNSLIITVTTSPEQEARLLDSIRNAGDEPFNAVTANCSDFVAHQLTEVFGPAGFHIRPRALRVADAWIMTPLAVATDFISFARRENVPVSVRPVPMLAGTRRSSAEITSISRGALVPRGTQGKMAMSIRVYFNMLNPLLAITALVTDKSSGFVDLRQLAYSQGSEEISRVPDGANTRQIRLSEGTPLTRDRVRIFGTASCWQTRRQEFATIEASAVEAGLLSKAEQKLLLKQGRPYVLPRFYEQAARACGKGATLLAGMQGCAPRSAATTLAFGFMSAPPSAAIAADTLTLLPTRARIRDMDPASASPADLQIAFKVMTSLINHDLSVDGRGRRTTLEFDADWDLFLKAAENAGIHRSKSRSGTESLAACSVRAFEAGTDSVDALAQERTPGRIIAREAALVAHGANR